MDWNVDENQEQEITIQNEEDWDDLFSLRVTLRNQLKELRESETSLQNKVNKLQSGETTFEPEIEQEVVADPIQKQPTVQTEIGPLLENNDNLPKLKMEDNSLSIQEIEYQLREAKEEEEKLVKHMLMLEEEITKTMPPTDAEALEPFDPVEEVVFEQPVKKSKLDDPIAKKIENIANKLKSVQQLANHRQEKAANRRYDPEVLKKKDVARTKIAVQDYAMKKKQMEEAKRLQEARQDEIKKKMQKLNSEIRKSNSDKVPLNRQRSVDPKKSTENEKKKHIQPQAKTDVKEEKRSPTEREALLRYAQKMALVIEKQKRREKERETFQLAYIEEQQRQQKRDKVVKLTEMIKQAKEDPKILKPPYIEAIKEMKPKVLLPTESFQMKVSPKVIKLEDKFDEETAKSNPYLFSIVTPRRHTPFKDHHSFEILAEKVSDQPAVTLSQMGEENTVTENTQVVTELDLPQKSEQNDSDERIESQSNQIEVIQQSAKASTSTSPSSSSLKLFCPPKRVAPQRTPLASPRQQSDQTNSSNPTVHNSPVNNSSQPSTPEVAIEPSNEEIVTTHQQINEVNAPQDNSTVEPSTHLKHPSVDLTSESSLTTYIVDSSITKHVTLPSSEIMKQLQTPTLFFKYTKQGKGKAHERYFIVELDTKIIKWSKNGKLFNRKASVKKVMRGSLIDKQQYSEEVQQKSLTIVCNNAVNLYITAKTIAMANLWFEGLEEVLKTENS